MKIKKILVSPIILIGLILYYFADVIFFNNVLSFRDLSRYFYPLRLFTADCLKNGICPLWNPYIFSGVPHLAFQQSIIFYPLSAIYYLFPFDKAFNIFLVVHILLAGIFVYLLCKRWGYDEAPALLSSILFMFNGYTIFIMNLATTLSSVIWLPIILFFFDKALTGGSLRSVFISALFLGIMFLGGEPSIFYSTLWVLLFYALFFWFNNREKITFPNVSRYYIILIIFGTVLSAIQLIPFLELMKLSDRTLGSPVYEYVTKWSLPLKDTFNFLIPFLMRGDFSKESYWKEQNWVIFIYVGVFALFLILMACLLKRRDWRVRFLAFIGVLFLFVSYGSSTPFYRIIYNFIPGFKFVRYPVRFLYVTIFAISMLAGAGLQAYIEGKKESGRQFKAFFKYTLVVLYLFSVIFLALHLYENGFIALARNFCMRYLDPKTQGGVLYSLIGAIMNIKRFLGFLIAGGVLLFLGSRLKIRDGVINFAFLSLVLVDLVTVVPEKQIMLNSASMHSVTPNMAYLKNDKTSFRFFQSPKTREADTFLKGKTYEEAVESAKDKLSPNWPMIYGLYDAYGYDSIRLKRYINFMTIVDTAGSPTDTRILDMLNVKYLIIMDEMKAGGYRFINKGSAYLYENKNVLPRAFLADSFEVLKNEVDIASRLKSKDFDPTKKVILEEDPPAKSMVYGLQSMVQEAAEIIKYSPNEVVIKAAVNSPKFLVLADTYYPGWKVYVDGKRDKLYVANYTLRTVYLDAGEHIVRFVFDPFSFKLGLGISLSAFVIIIFYIVHKKI